MSTFFLTFRLTLGRLFNPIGTPRTRSTKKRQIKCSKGNGRNHFSPIIDARWLVFHSRSAHDTLNTTTLRCESSDCFCKTDERCDNLYRFYTLRGWRGKVLVLLKSERKFMFFCVFFSKLLRSSNSTASSVGAAEGSQQTWLSRWVNLHHHTRVLGTTVFHLLVVEEDQLSSCINHRVYETLIIRCSSHSKWNKLSEKINFY